MKTLIQFVAFIMSFSASFSATQVFGIGLETANIKTSIPCIEKERESNGKHMVNERPVVPLNEYVGQTKVVAFLKEQIKGAQALASPLRHCLLLGNPGLGKTAMARSIAHAMGTKLSEVSGRKQLTPYLLSEMAKAFQPMDILFIDEIHSVSHELQIFLQRLMTEQIVPVFERTAISGKIKEVGETKVAPITLIGATDRPGLLLKALYSRFGSPLILLPYAFEDMKIIVRQLACRIGLTLTDEAHNILAGTSKGLPRVSEQYLDDLKAFAAANQIVDLTADRVRESLRSQGLDQLGLNELDRTYLKHLAQVGEVGAKLNTLASILSIDAFYLQRQIEPMLQHIGFLHIDGRRFITVKGITYLEGGEHEKV